MPPTYVRGLKSGNHRWRRDMRPRGQVPLGPPATGANAACEGAGFAPHRLRHAERHNDRSSPPRRRGTA
jgi:hypothetical protein